MKKALFLIFLVSPYAKSQTWQLFQDSSPENCGGNVSCYFYQEQAKKAQELDEKREEQEEANDDYRNQLLQLQTAQLEEVRHQNEVLESELQEMNDRQSKIEDELVKLEGSNQKSEKSPAQEGKEER